MAGLEMLRMLSAKSVDINATPGGNPDITPEMVAGALGYGDLSEPASLYCRIKYQLQDDLRIRLQSWISRHKVLKWGIAENWQCGLGILPKLSYVALDESLSDNLCRRCKGTGNVKIENKVIACKSCDGTGHKRYTKREISRRLGIHHSTFSTIWVNRYNRVLSVYVGFDDEIKQCLKKL